MRDPTERYNSERSKELRRMPKADSYNFERSKELQGAPHQSKARCGVNSATLSRPFDKEAGQGAKRRYIRAQRESKEAERRYNSDRSEELQGARRRYNWIWDQLPVQNPSIWPSWEICKDFVGRQCLEIGCGNYPRIPLESGYFLDISEMAVNNLEAQGLNAFLGTAERLPFGDNFFDLVVTWDVMEHVPNDRKAFAEVSRVLKPGGYFLFSVPLGKKHFGPWDTAVGHLRRYEAAELGKTLRKNGFQVVKFQGQNLLKYVLRIPFLYTLLSKFADPPLRRCQINLPIPHQLRAGLVRGYAFVGRLLAVPWRTGPLEDISDEANITVFCRKKS